jgi:branched-chain amino acid transport system ATP-binding protein
MLKIINLQAGYGDLRVVQGVSLHVRPGEAVALVGANGAGKSTLLKAATGLLRPSGGRVLLNGRDVAGWPAERVARVRLTLVPEGRGLFPQMTVLDNLRMGGYASRLSGARLDERLAVACAAFPVLNERLRSLAGELSGGQQQMLAVARALVSDPAVMLLDEPSTGLAPLLVRDILGRLRELCRTGLAVVLAEQNVRDALRLADRGYVMESGRVVLDGPAAELLASEQVRTAYLGM